MLPFACTDILVLVITKARHKANGIITHKRPAAQPIKIKGEKIKCFQHSCIVTGTSCVTNDFMSCLEVGFPSKATGGYEMK